MNNITPHRKCTGTSTVQIPSALYLELGDALSDCRSYTLAYKEDPYSLADRFS